MTPLRTLVPSFLCLAGLAAGCAPSGRGTAACGITAMAGPSLLLDQFRVPNQTLGLPPASLPNVLPVRMAAGRAFRAAVARADSGWLIGVEGPLPPSPTPGFGVLILDRVDGPVGVLLYEGTAIRGAPLLGMIATPTKSLPLIGIEVNVSAFDNPACPLFPDSLRR